MSEITNKTLSELKAEAATILNEYNRVLNKPQDGDNLAKIENNLKEAIDAYNTKSKNLVFTALKVAENPMLAAVKKLNFEIIRTKAEKNTITGFVTYKLDDTGEQQIKLSEFDKFCDGEASADNSWTDILSKFCLLATYKNCLDLGEKMKTVRDRLEQTYQISQTAHDIDMGKTPLSQTQMTKNLQKLLDAVVGENILKVIPRDLEYVYKLMNRRGGCGVVVSPRPQTMEILLMDVLHNVIMNKSYVVSYQQKKNAVPSANVESIDETADTTVDDNGGDAE